MIKLLTGATGMIGKNLKEKIGFSLTPTKEELDLTDINKVRTYLNATNPDQIIHCASNDDDICLYDNLRMFHNLAESGIPMLTFCTGREIEDRSYKNGEYVFSKYLIKELGLNKYANVKIIQLWGCFGKYERDIRFFKGSMLRILKGLPITIGEDKLFSYVYIDDLVKIIQDIPLEKYSKIVAYTYPLSYYGNLLRSITGYSPPVIVEKDNFPSSYVGKNTVGYCYSPLENCINEMWKWVKREYEKV